MRGLNLVFSLFLSSTFLISCEGVTYNYGDVDGALSGNSQLNGDSTNNNSNGTQSNSPQNNSPSSKKSTSDASLANSQYYPAKSDDELGFTSNDPNILKAISKAYTHDWNPRGTQSTTPNSVDPKTYSRILCLVRPDTSLWCSGTGRVYVGDGSLRSDRSFRKIIDHGVHRVKTNSDVTCAIKTNSSLWCWGALQNNSAEDRRLFTPLPLLGDGTRSFSTTPKEIISAGVAKLVMGTYRHCAILHNGELQCWGKDISSRPKTIFSSGVTEVYLSSFSPTVTRTCARVHGALKCWKDKSHSQIETVLTAQELTGVSKISVGTRRICYVKNYQLLCKRDQESCGGTTIKFNNAHVLKADKYLKYDFLVPDGYAFGVRDVFITSRAIFVLHVGGKLSRMGLEGAHPIYLAGTDYLLNHRYAKRRYSKITNASNLFSRHAFNQHSACVMRTDGAFLCLPSSNKIDFISKESLNSLGDYTDIAF